MAKRQSATRSLWASATIMIFLIRPPTSPTRWRNQTERALSGCQRSHNQASSSNPALAREFPALLIPCSRSLPPAASGKTYRASRMSAWPSRVANSLESRVPSPSWSARLKAASTAARYSSFVRVPSLSGSAADQSFFEMRPCNSLRSRVPSLSRSRRSKTLFARP